MDHLQPARFLDLANDVLVAAGRQPLPKDSPQHHIITVTSTDRVLQVLAGPGSGKTEMLVWRVLYELLVLGTPSHRVMVTTFTRRAATDLQVRLAERAEQLHEAATTRNVICPDTHIHDIRVGTIHSLCDALLAEFSDQYLSAGTQVIDDVETKIRLARHYRFLGFNPPSQPPRVLNRLLSTRALTSLFCAPWEDPTTWPSSQMDRADCIQAILNQHTETWIPRCSAAQTPHGTEMVHGPATLTADLQTLQKRWEDYLDSNHILDFATIQKRFTTYQPSLYSELDHVFVDEFQDNNPIQFVIHTQWLASEHIRLTVVGDDDQAIYRFRGSDIACFNDLAPYCANRRIPYRVQHLLENNRSTSQIVRFCQDFRTTSHIAAHSMAKTVKAPKNTPPGTSVRLLEGSWSDLCQCAAAELTGMSVGIPQEHPTEPTPSAAFLMFSTSERASKYHMPPASVLNQTLLAKGIKTYNPRSKTANAPTSPVSQLLGLISYLIDPVTKAPVGKNGRPVQVAASIPSDPVKSGSAVTNPPSFAINDDHLAFQKRFVRANGGDIGQPAPDRAPLLQYLDQIRKALTNAQKPRLTIAGLVARLLSFPFFRSSGYTPDLFRQALFTTLLEANIAPTRLSRQSLDSPLRLSLVNGKYTWEDRYWSLLNIFGAFLRNSPLDDPEVEAFEENAVLLLTFHQAKGLEFDHVYVAATGRTPDVGPALRTALFSGQTPNYLLSPHATTDDASILGLAKADRDREVYVALTRPKMSLTILHDPADGHDPMRLNPAIEALFKNRTAKKSPWNANITIREY